MEYRRLGRTGHDSSVAIMGGAACWAATPDEAGQWFSTALDAGVNHIDIAPQYGAAETVVGPHLAEHRQEIFVAGKTLRANPDGVQDQFDQTRRLLGADVLDLYQAHGVTTVEELDRRSGALERILRLRDRGRARFAGITGHNMTVPATFLEALRRFDLDTVMFPVYPGVWGRPDYREAAEELLALCGERDLGVMAIKAVARRPWGDGLSIGDPARWADSWYEPVSTDEELARGIHFALSTPGVHAFCTPGDRALLPRVLDAAESYAPQTEAQRQQAMDEMAPEGVIFPMPR